MPDALGGVGGIRVGVAFFGGGQAAAKFAEGALGFARQTYRLGAAVVGEFVALGGEVDLDPVVAVAGLFVGDDEAGGECRFDKVVGGRAEIWAMR